MSKPRMSLYDLLRESAEAAAAAEKESALRAQQAKYAAAMQQQPGELDLTSTEVISALAKSARVVAARLAKSADGESLEDGAGAITEGSTPLEETVDPEGPPPDLQPPQNVFSIPQQTSQPPGPPSMTPSTDQPENELPDAKAAAVRRVHDIYARAIRKLSEQPTGGVEEPTEPMAGSAPEAATDHPSTVPDDEIGGDEQATQLTREDAVSRLRTEEADILGSQAVAAAEGDPVLNQLPVDGEQPNGQQPAGEENEGVKAAALRALIAQRVRAGDPRAHDLMAQVKRAQDEVDLNVAFPSPPERASTLTIPALTGVPIPSGLERRPVTLMQGEPPQVPKDVRPPQGIPWQMVGPGPAIQIPAAGKIGQAQAPGFAGRPSLGSRTPATPDARQTTDISPEPGAPVTRPKPGTILSPGPASLEQQPPVPAGKQAGVKRAYIDPNAPSPGQIDLSTPTPSPAPPVIPNTPSPLPQPPQPPRPPGPPFQTPVISNPEAPAASEAEAQAAIRALMSNMQNPLEGLQPPAGLDVYQAPPGGYPTYPTDQDIANLAETIRASAGGI